MNEQAIQWAVDEMEIRNLIASLALLSDLGDIEEWGMLFAEDADYTTGGGAAWHGRAEIVEGGLGSAGDGGRMDPGAANGISAVGPGSLHRS